ncbi:MAG TPA: ABC transporter ATP-binding protein [Thermomicrobiales bacterium]|nr:ABC transporter ATP-binding protein [Thermomicrobiales bacterium]
MSTIELRSITKRFPGVIALDNVTFDVKDGEFFVLLGPTGAGKTTTLRVIAGLERQDEGNVLFDGEAVDNLTPPDRDVAFVFQQYSLYPTMTVFDNLAFPLRSPLRKLSAAEIKQRVEDAARTLRISHLLERKTAHLSGGEMQRVSIGRAIVRQPRVFLMDEPLSNLDAKLREALRVELQHLQRTQGSTTLFVTHDQVEALTLAHRIGVLNEGRLVQIGTPEDIYDRPASTFVAQLVGTPRINLFPGLCENGTVYAEGSELHLPLPRSASIPQRFLLGVRPEDVTINPEGQYTGEVLLTEPLGVETIVHIGTGQQRLLSLVPGITPLRVGDNVRFDVTHNRLHCFDLDGKRIPT